MSSRTAATASARARRAAATGVGLVELALALAVAALILSGAILYFQNASASQKANESVQFLAAVRAAAEQLYSSQTDFEGVSAEFLMTSAILPSRHYSSKGGLVHPYGGRVDVQNSNLMAADRPKMLKIVFRRVPQAACIRLATTPSGAIEVAANGGTPIEEDQETRGTSMGQMTPEAAQTACYRPDQNDMGWTY